MFSRPVSVPSAAPPKPYTVSELLAEVSTVLRTSWRDVAVVGEIGRFDLRGGHGYFTLKDASAALPAIIFASDLKRVPFRLEPGLEVVVRGALDLYSPQGKFQIKAFAIEPVGRGALQLAFEQLKAKLEVEGLFAAERKRPIPKLPRTIAIVTSPTGAVVRDVLHVLSRRFEGLAITIYPVRVQGELAAAEIVAAIRQLNARGGFDVLILARGGGSPEDLAPFNAEAVARALAASTIPTISGVGHETDWTICDLVADLRAPTPSAAAELVVERKDEIARRVAHGRMRVLSGMQSRLALGRAKLQGLGRSDALAGFARRLAELAERVAQGREALVVLSRAPARGVRRPPLGRSADARRLSARRRARSPARRGGGRPGDARRAVRSRERAEAGARVLARVAPRGSESPRGPRPRVRRGVPRSGRPAADLGGRSRERRTDSRAAPRGRAPRRGAGRRPDGGSGAALPAGRK